MVKLFIYSLLVVLVVQDGRAEQQQQLDFQDMLNNAKNYLDGWSKELREKVGLSENPSGEEMVRVFKEHNEKLAQNLKDTGKKLEEQLKSNPDLQKVVENVKSKFNEEAEKLKQSNPELAQNAENLGKSLQGTWDALTQEMEKSYKEFDQAGGKREEVEQFFGSLLNKVKTGAQDLQNKLQELNKKETRRR